MKRQKMSRGWKIYLAVYFVLIVASIIAVKVIGEDMGPRVAGILDGVWSGILMLGLSIYYFFGTKAKIHRIAGSVFFALFCFSAAKCLWFIFK